MLDFHFNNPYNNPDSFTGFYVNNFSDMERLSPPFGGTVVGVNIEAGFLWSKRFDTNGIPVIRTFRLEEVRTETENERLSRELAEVRKELELLKGGNRNVSKDVDESITQPIEITESTSIQPNSTNAI